MFKKMIENAQPVAVIQRNLGIKMKYSDIGASSVKKYFNQKEEKERN